ncbi:hypothetical protein [Microlunatus soli]|uniref:Uncharacterized protein n=1 Tax=Microlunatus soli TaxID=630515 RepID=A0A1H1ZIK0_9ACTN|nr:hypothetical protein [Microlunatus soli]SDT33483.1 hypothetical protein SAMN04489812_5245 [Microlunatus soli]
MRTFHTSVTDLRQPFSGSFTTYPYECGWADEAIYFVTAEDQTPAGAEIALRVQLSADGIRWVDEGSTLQLSGPDAGFVRLAHFGGFLRLAGEVSADHGQAVLTVRLVLKG